MIKLTLVPTTLMPFFIDRVIGILVPAIELSDGEVTEESTKSRLLVGSLLLVLATDGNNIEMAITVDIIEYESGKRELSLPLIAGNRLDDLSDSFMPFMVTIAKNYNCSSIQGYAARKGWVGKLKNYGWKPVREIIKYRIES